MDTLQRQYTVNSKQIFPEMKQRGVSPIHFSMSDLYTLLIGLLLQENRWTDRGNIQYKSLTDTMYMNVDFIYLGYCL